MSKIGIFDSGIGGVTVLKEILLLLPNNEYIYYSDSINNPYGDKTKEELYSIVKNIVDYLIKMDCNIIVIACNTASSICVDDLRIEYKDIIFVAVEPALKVASDYSRDKNTLVLATKGTIESDRFNNLYEKYANSTTYIHSCIGLANLIEEGNNKEIDEYLDKELDFFKDKNIEVVVLGCTHYPLIKNNISKVLGNIIFYDGSIGTAKRVKYLVDGESKYSLKFIDSSNSTLKEKRFFDILEDK